MVENEKPENPKVYPDPMRGAEQTFTNQDPWNLNEGITLRDHFAGLAMQALLSNPAIFNESNKDTKQFYVYKSYQFADAMLEQRQQ